MSSGQKVIKYCAIAFAVFLIVSIFGGIFTVASVFLFGSSFKGFPFYISAEDREVVNITKEFNDVKNLSIDLNEYRLIVKQGETDTVMVEANDVDSDFRAELRSNRTLVIDDDSNGIHIDFWGHSPAGTVTVTIPKELSFHETFFDLGSGNTEIDGIVTELFELESGSGAVSISDLVTDKFDIDTGSGAVEVNNTKGLNAEADFGSGSIRMTNCMMDNLELSMGSGSLVYDGVLKGDTEIDGASGRLELNLVGEEKDYTIECDAGSGHCRLNGDFIGDVELNKGAKNTLSIDGGSGNVEINFIDK